MKSLLLDARGGVPPLRVKFSQTRKLIIAVFATDFLQAGGSQNVFRLSKIEETILQHSKGTQFEPPRSKNFFTILNGAFPLSFEIMTQNTNRMLNNKIVNAPIPLSCILHTDLSISKSTKLVKCHCLTPTSS